MRVGTDHLGDMFLVVLGITLLFGVARASPSIDIVMDGRVGSSAARYWPRKCCILTRGRHTEAGRPLMVVDFPSAASRPSEARGAALSGRVSVIGMPQLGRSRLLVRRRPPRPCRHCAATAPS